jgi:DNA-binding transcriptional LysR family regulator
MSAALARLRRHFDDDLLSRVGGHYELTALGQVLLDRTATACDLLERVFTSQADFDPATESREFAIVSSDCAVAVYGAELARTIHQEAPGIRLHFTQTPAASSRRPARC